MARVGFTTTQTRLWSLAVIAFAAASVFGMFYGAKLSHGIAFRYHEHAAQNFLADYDYRRALDELKAVVWLEPDNPDAVLNLADTHLVLGEWLEARDWLDTLQGNPARPDGFGFNFLMAQIDLKSENGDPSKWLEQMRETTVREKGGLALDLLTAHVARVTGNGKTATQGYESILETRPDHAEALYRLAIAAQLQLRNEDIAQYRRALKDASGDLVYTAEFRRIQADAHHVLDRGQEELDAGTSLPAERFELLGLSALNLGQWERAMDFFERAESAGGGSWQVEYWLGVRADAQGNREVALEKFRAAAKKQPGENALPQRNIDHLTKN